MVHLLSHATTTKWVLFLASSSDPEHRFLFDIAFGVYCLESKGVNPADIFIYIDGNNRNDMDSIVSVGTPHTYNIKPTKDFFTDCAQNTHKNIMMFFTGHGSINGLDANIPITPCMLLDSLKRAPSLERAVLYLGQCYSGVFNYVKANKGARRPDGTDDPEVIFIGATNLHESLSSNTQEQLHNGSYSWCANIFLLHLFKWISNPVDIDGDGHYTVMDSYKYAGVMSNKANKGSKVGSFFNSIKLHGEYMEAKAIHEQYEHDYLELIKVSPGAQKILKPFIDMKAAETKYVNQLDVHLVHQECWILNSIPSQKIEL